MMQFDLTAEQMQLKETARCFAAEEIIPVAARSSAVVLARNLLKG
jgi:hypothetical protein